MGAPIGVLIAVVVRHEALELGGDERADRGSATSGQHFGLPDHVLIELYRQVPLGQGSSSDCAPQSATWRPGSEGRATFHLRRRRHARRTKPQSSCGGAARFTFAYPPGVNAPNWPALNTSLYQRFRAPQERRELRFPHRVVHCPSCEHRIERPNLGRLARPALQLTPALANHSHPPVPRACEFLERTLWYRSCGIQRASSRLVTLWEPQ